MAHKRIDLTPTKTYATPATMEKQIEKLTQGDQTYRYIAMTTEGGRHYPVFLLSAEQAQAAVYFANKGFCSAVN